MLRMTDWLLGIVFEAMIVLKHIEELHKYN